MMTKAQERAAIAAYTGPITRLDPGIALGVSLIEAITGTVGAPSQGADRFAANRGSINAANRRRSERARQDREDRARVIA